MKITVSVERRIGAPADRVYAYVADFTTHHPKFLPPAFESLVVEEGGIGEGTVHHFTLTLAGRTSTTRARVTEPEPGRVLTETEEARGMTTSFIVDPTADGASHVTIESSWESGGVRGLVERMLAPRMLRRLYAEELELLDRYARETSRRTVRVANEAHALVVGG